MEDGVARSDHADEHRRPTEHRRARDRGFCFTINNYDPIELEALHDLRDGVPNNGIICIVYQCEVGEQGTPHVQGYLYFRNARSIRAAQILVGARSSLRKANGGRRANLAYCTKEEGRIEGPWQAGDFPTIGERSDLKTCLASATYQEAVADFPEVVARYPRGIRDVFQERARMQYGRMLRPTLSVTVLWGATGVGKTHRVFASYPDVYRVDISGPRIWFDGYCGQDTILFDEFYGNIKPAKLLELLDRYPLSCEIKGSYVWARWQRVFITSNEAPEEWYRSIPRAVRDAIMRRITHIVHVTSKDQVIIGLGEIG